LGPIGRGEPQKERGKAGKTGHARRKKRVLGRPCRSGYNAGGGKIGRKKQGSGAKIGKAGKARARGGETEAKNGGGLGGFDITEGQQADVKFRSVREKTRKQNKENRMRKYTAIRHFLGRGVEQGGDRIHLLGESEKFLGKKRWGKALETTRLVGGEKCPEEGLAWTFVERGKRGWVLS